MAAPSFPAEKFPDPFEYNRAILKPGYYSAALLELHASMDEPSFPPEKIREPGGYNRTNAAGLNGAFDSDCAQPYTKNKSHMQAKLDQVKYLSWGDIGSDCSQLDQFMVGISETYPSVRRENQVIDLSWGDIGSYCAQLSDEIVAVYTKNIPERSARTVFERYLKRSARTVFERYLKRYARAVLERPLLPGVAIQRIRAVADQLSHCKDGDTGIRGPASVRCIVLTENQVEDLKLFGGDCAYTQSVGDFPVTAFLEWTGYLKPIDSGGVHDVPTISSALKRYQLNHGLEDTGIIDVPTVSMMSSRRCGAPDIVDGLNITRFHGSDASCFNVFPGGPKWENTNLTYHYYSSVPEAAKPAFKLAFDEWTRVRPEFTFTEVPAAGDIKISFCRGKHGSGDCLPFNGPGGVLAHSFAPCDGRLHVDESQLWSFRNIPNAAYFVDLESAVLHEIGHILGMSHCYDKNAVMFPSLKPNEIKNRLTRDDIHGINFLYGKY